MLLLDEPFGALDAFTREELWCTLRDLQAAQKFNVILVTHDLRESVFLADTVYVMSKSPGRMVVRREIDLARPRDLEVTYTPEFTDIVHELRGHIGAVRRRRVQLRLSRPVLRVCDRAATGEPARSGREARRYLPSRQWFQYLCGQGRAEHGYLDGLFGT